MKIKAIQAIERHLMLRPGDTVLAAVSGGADSMALLHVLNDIKEEYSFTLLAAHFNHLIRGEEAYRDERFVRQACERLGIELFVGSADIPALARLNGMGLEECGRRERYAFFESVAPEAKIATAHTLSDCEETFVFNLARGSSLRGLGSIPPVRDSIIRPLIGCTRAEVELYCEENGIAFVTDSTNLSDEYTRNSIRHNVIPQLKKINSGFDAAFSRCVEGLREDEELLGILTGELLEAAEIEGGWECERLLSAHPALRRRAVAVIIERLSGEKPQAQHISAVCGILTGGSTQVVTGITLVVRRGVLSQAADRVESWSRDFALGLNKLPLETVNARLFDNSDKINIQIFNKEVLANVIDYDKIRGTLSFGSAAKGDKIRPSGRGVTKQLRRIFNEMHIDPALRSGIAVLRDGEDIVWVSGVGVSESYRADNNTVRFLQLKKVEET